MDILKQKELLAEAEACLDKAKKFNEIAMILLREAKQAIIKEG